MAIVNIDDKVHRSIICCMFANGDGKKKLGKKAFLLEPAISISAFFYRSDLLQENEQYSSNRLPQLQPVTIPSSQLNGGGDYNRG